MSDETEALRAEMAELRAEVERLNAELAAARVTVHPGIGAGCAGGAATYTYTVPWSSTATNTITVTPLHYNVAGAAPMPQITMYGTGGECA